MVFGQSISLLEKKKNTEYLRVIKVYGLSLEYFITRANEQKYHMQISTTEFPVRQKIIQNYTKNVGYSVSFSIAGKRNITFRFFNKQCIILGISQCLVPYRFHDVISGCNSALYSSFDLAPPNLIYLAQPSSLLSYFSSSHFLSSPFNYLFVQFGGPSISSQIS